MRAHKGAAGASFDRCRALVRAVAAGLALTLLLEGCTTMTALPVESLPPQGLKDARVILKDDYTYRFSRVRVEGDQLLGTYSVVEEKTAPDGTVTYEDMQRETRIPVAQVKEVRVGKRDIGKTLLIGAGGVIFGVWLAGALDKGEETPADSGGHKPPQ